MDRNLDEWIPEMLDPGDELIAKVKGNKLSEFTKHELKRHGLRHSPPLARPPPEKLDEGHGHINKPNIRR